VRELVYDPWRFAQAARELEREGMTVVEFAQTDVRMCPTSQRLRDAIVERRLVIPPDPELAKHAGDAIMRHSRRGWRLDRPARSITIDGVVALALALERAEEQPAPVELLGWL
jgi:phage terminase large subunit-like protein